MNNCEYCNKNFSTKYTLKNHQNTKSCLLKQNENKQLFKCYECKKIYSTKYKLDIHITKYKHSKESKLLHITNLENSIIEYKTSEKIKDILLKDKDIKIKELEDRLERLVGKSSTNNININNNNKILNISALDLNQDKLKTIFDTKYNQKYIIYGQKGLARFVFDHCLKDENGNLTYVCTDRSRQIFKYKDNLGDIQKDIKAQKLTKTLIDGGLKSTTCEASTNWWTNEEGNTDNDKYTTLQPKALEICTLSIHENTLFVNELSAMTMI